MAEIAERAGVDRAALYEHFADIQSLLTAWHHRRPISTCTTWSAL